MMPSIPYQYDDDKNHRDEEVDDHPGEHFTGFESNYALPPGQPNVSYPITPEDMIEFMEAMKAMEAAKLALAKSKAKSDKYANGAVGTRMTGTENSKRRSAQQSSESVPPSDTQSTSRGGIPNQRSPSARPSSRPKSNKGKSRVITQSNSGPQQNFNGCFRPDVKNDNSFNNNYYGSRWPEEDQEETSSEEDD